jgi:hypothetical protein
LASALTFAVWIILLYQALSVKSALSGVFDYRVVVL